MSTPSKSRPSPRVTIEVTDDVIETSTARDSSHCMIADAIAKALPSAKYISVDLATIRFTDLNAGCRYIYLTPRPAQEALLAFDQGEQVEPFSVRLQGAHVLATGTGRKGRTTLEPNEGGTSKRRVGGQAPPLGPLIGGAPREPSKGVKLPGAGSGNRTGRRREFGLRAIIR